MQTLQDLNNDMQASLASGCLGNYRRAVLNAHEDYQELSDLSGMLSGLEDFLGKVDQTQLSGHEPIKHMAVAWKGNLNAELQKNRSERPGVEILVNQYDIATDVILPIKAEDLKSDKLAASLYEHVSKVCGDKDGTEMTWQGYLVFSLPEGTDKKTLSKQLLENVPAELGGDGQKVPILYLRVANNLSFQYDGRQVDHSEHQVSPTGEGSSSGSSSGPDLQDSGVKDTISREEAIEYFGQGRTSRDLHEEFPGNTVRQLAAWLSHIRMDTYEKTG